MNWIVLVLFFLAFVSNLFTKCDQIDSNENLKNEIVSIIIVDTMYRISNPGVDVLAKWVNLNGCSNRFSKKVKHVETEFAWYINILIKKVHHAALQFDIVCPDNTTTIYTIEFSKYRQNDGTYILRRFGYYEKPIKTKEEAAINFSIRQINQITNTTNK